MISPLDLQDHTVPHRPGILAVFLPKDLVRSSCQFFHAKLILQGFSSSFHPCFQFSPNIRRSHQNLFFFRKKRKSPRTCRSRDLTLLSSSILPASPAQRDGKRSAGSIFRELRVVPEEGRRILRRRLPSGTRSETARRLRLHAYVLPAVPPLPERRRVELGASTREGDEASDILVAVPPSPAFQPAAAPASPTHRPPVRPLPTASNAAAWRHDQAGSDDGGKRRPGTGLAAGPGGQEEEEAG